LITARSLSPTDERISKYLDWIVKNLDYEGDQLFKQERWDQAAEVFDLGLRLDPDNNTLMKRQGFNDKPRVDDLLAQLPARRNDFWFHLRVDHALFVSERFPEIIALWEAYLVETPDDPRAYWERAGAYYHHGNRDAWLADMKKSCDLGLQRGCDDFQRNNR
jgi:tetratricopeptide (TPR) repeat protein